jgi:hypothetical protein
LSLKAAVQPVRLFFVAEMAMKVLASVKYLFYENGEGKAHEQILVVCGDSARRQW